jgi:septum site-determining protein MinC
MPIDSQKTPNKSQALEFKSSTFSVPVLVLSSVDLGLIEQQLQEKISLAPEFFRNSPLVLDLQEINKHGYNIDVTVLTGLIRKAGLLPIGIRGGNLQQNKQALELLIPVYSIHSGGVSAENKKQKKITPVPEPKSDKDKEVTTTTLITQPIRSGQRIYAAGDLVILAQVSAGSEIIV